MKVREKCCVDKCNSDLTNDAVLHRFPNPSISLERFNIWVKNSGLIGEDQNYIYSNRRICRLHFEERYHCLKNRLKKAAVPTLHLPGCDVPAHTDETTSMDEVLETTTTSIESADNDNETITLLTPGVSIDSDDATSNTSNSTPTKKRGGRLAAKPQLDLIEENATETPSKQTKKRIMKDLAEPVGEKAVTPSRRSARVRSNTSIVSETPGNAVETPTKQTRKPIIKDLAEPAGEKAVTPSRRSARVRSNTSIVSETPGNVAEEKPATPARRNGRIRSNTSIVSEALVNIDSPRAKRAARRNSQVGSDTEAAATPVRQARRTRKDSASSIDKAEITNNVIGSQIKEVIIEEGETNVQETNNNITPKSDALPLKKSPRMVVKVPKKVPEAKKNNKENVPQTDDESNDLSQNKDEEKILPVEDCLVSLKPHMSSRVKSTAPDSQNISISSSKLIDTDTKKTHSSLNKSTSIIEEPKSKTYSRQRTKSWTTISMPQSNDKSLYTDIELSKKVTNTDTNRFNETGSGDGIKYSSDQFKQSQMNGLDINEKVTSNFEKNITVAALRYDFADVTDKPITTENKIEKLFEKSPTGIIQSLVYIEDSDSNSCSKVNDDIEKPFKRFDDQTPLKGFDDQCVPVVNHLKNDISKQDNNYSCEPMDIDETIPSDITHIQPESENKISSLVEKNNINKSSGNATNKSIISTTDIPNLGKTDEEKSTLVLSHMKDMSSQNTAEVPIIVNSNQSETPKPKYSKSFNIETEKTKDTDKKNVSLTYSTNTPLQQKSIARLGLPMNTSIITPNNQNKISKSKNIDSKSKKDLQKRNVSYTDSSEDSESENELSIERKKMVDDEAEEASDNYESGDSRDDDERQYEEDNEIKEKGETLDSEDDDQYSDDSDYEKGSFIVSSDDEDNELLSGSGDDLSTSANELNMSKKSKKKFNDRKTKESKKASREMFEARHNTDKNIKAKSKMRLDSSESEGDVKIKPKKKRRQRIESYQDVTNNSLHKNTLETTRLADSECDHSASAEKEISICNEANTNKKEDPLRLNTIKNEPKTPQKMLEMSTVEIISRDEVEEVKVDENVSIIMKPNETSDPLQNTILQNNSQDEGQSEDESLSENEEIKQNYDSILTDLNKIKTKHIKSLDMSLNLNTKTKKKTKEPIIEELNLTQVKTSKKKKVKNPKPSELILQSENDKGKKENGKFSGVNGEIDNSSDSIDMKLLFPEDSNDSEPFDIKENTKQTSNNTKDIDDDFIPLRRTNAKTNILENKDDQEEKNSSFFFDNTGTYINEAESDRSLNTTKNKKSLNTSHAKSVSLIGNEDIEEFNEINADNSVLNITKENAKKKRSKNDSDADMLITMSAEQEDKKRAKHGTVDTEDIHGKEESHIEKSTKTKNKKWNSFVEDVIENNEAKVNSFSVVEENVYGDLKNSSKKKKHKANISLQNLNISTSIYTANNELENSVKVPDGEILNGTLIKSDKKRKNKKMSESQSLEQADPKHIDVDSSEERPAESSEKKKKKKKRLSGGEDIDINSRNNSLTTVEDKTFNDETNSAKKNKHKTNVSLENIDENNLLDTSVNSSAKMNKSSSSLHHADDDNTEPFKNKTRKDGKKNNGDTLMNEEKDSEIRNDAAESDKKKKKKKVSECHSPEKMDEKDVEICNETVQSDKKKKKKKVSESQSPEQTDISPKEGDVEISVQKRKRKSSANTSKDEIALIDNGESSKSLNESTVSVNKKKKRKVCDENEAPEISVNDLVSEQSAVVKKSKKKNKEIYVEDDHDHLDGPMEVPISRRCSDDIDKSNTGILKQSKKRKHRDDEENKVSKILKQKSSDTIHVPRLPADILKQLDDKPNKVMLETRKANLISTTSFVVEESRKRKNKPSNYLEQSVCLNDSVEHTRKPSAKTKPKVLPFLPTVSTSDKGFTTTFRVNFIPQETQFVAQGSSVKNFKNQYLRKKSKKNLGTLEKYKRQMNAKLSKF